MNKLMLNRRQALKLGLGSVASLVLTACGGSEESVDAYIIATDTAFSPFEFPDESGSYTGIDVDLLAAVAADQGFAYELNPVGFDAALQSVQSGVADAVIAGMSITEERRLTYDFSDPYFEANVCAAAPAGGEVTSLDDLRSKTVAVKTGTQSMAWAESIMEEYGFECTEFATSDIMYQDVLYGNTACCFEDTPVMNYAIKTSENITLEVIAVSDEQSDFTKPYGFAVLKDQNAELLSMFNAGLANIKANGTYDEILAKYGITA